jgi:hypothetical protein
MACCAKGMSDIQPQETGATDVSSNFISTRIGAQLMDIMTGSTDNGSTIRDIHLLVKENNPVSLPCIFILEGRTQKCRWM